ncbi:MAG: FAD:protein FMN transferase [Clostridia bacterium]|nr:FAD:protein FMN transferase [Clostridia bacterium]
MKFFKSLSCLCTVLGLLVFLTGCPKPAHKAESKGMVYFTYFDTVSYIYSYAGDSNEEFEANCNAVAAVLGEYHRLFDIYHEYSGVTNLCTLNSLAGADWTQVDEKLIDFLLYAKELYAKTNGEMNIMLGSLLRIWHDSREAASSDPASAYVPETAVLDEAERHTSIDLLEIDKEAGAVRISDPEASIDVGALGKGYATEIAARLLYEMGVSGYVLNIGGNIRIIGEKNDGSGWNTGIKNPQNPETYANYITISDTSCVTSGNYERYFTLDGVRYHHIIDKDTLMPAEYFSSVTVVTPNSGLADALSTALFCMDYESGVKIAESFDGVHVLWILPDGTQLMTEGMRSLLTEKAPET